MRSLLAIFSFSIAESQEECVQRDKRRERVAKHSGQHFVGAGSILRDNAQRLSGVVAAASQKHIIMVASTSVTGHKQQYECAGGSPLKEKILLSACPAHLAH